jgi:hypothetical protein
VDRAKPHQASWCGSIVALVAADMNEVVPLS